MQTKTILGRTLRIPYLREEQFAGAVDVFVYDTTLDSDGGAWRMGAAALASSWYNETLNTATRGTRQIFPVVAVIVAAADRVTIYDGDDPTLPMWMIFNSSGGLATTAKIIPADVVSSVSAKNARIVIATDNSTGNRGGAYVVSLLADQAIRFSTSTNSNRLYNGTIAQRNDNLAYGALSGPALVNQAVRDIAMTVLPDAPTDPATGLPVPTIAVATAGGVSVIKDDGTVVDSQSTGDTRRVAFSDDGLWYTLNSVNVHDYFATYTDIAAGDGFSDLIVFSSIRPYLAYSAGQSGLVINGKGQYWKGGPKGASNLGVMSHIPDYSDFDSGMVFVATSTYNTAWMNGDIKGAFLSDTDDTDLVGSGELVTNGTFDTDISGWTDAPDGRSTASFVSGKLRITNDVSGYGYVHQTISTVVGKRYVIQWEPSAVGTLYATRVYMGTTQGSANVAASLAAGVTGPQKLTFVATSTTTFVGLQVYTASFGPTIQMDFDNISVKLADADRSVNNNGLIVNGTVARSPVATGAELVAYSGFSASNYLEQPYNSDLDFGTGDFCVMGWFKCASTSNQMFVLRSDPSVTSATFGFYSTAGLLATQCGQSPTSVAGTDVDNGMWNFLCQVRSSGVEYVYVNGSLVVARARTGTVTNTSATLRVGLDQSGARAGTTVSSSLLRISATAPTADQIAKIYRDELPLFQAGAACTIGGASDAVTALSFDPKTERLHVGTSGGRSVFRGLRRIEHSATPVTKSISAVGNLVGLC